MSIYLHVKVILWNCYMWTNPYLRFHYDDYEDVLIKLVYTLVGFGFFTFFWLPTRKMIVVMTSFRQSRCRLHRHQSCLLLMTMNNDNNETDGRLYLDSKKESKKRIKWESACVGGGPTKNLLLKKKDNK